MRSVTWPPAELTRFARGEQPTEATFGAHGEAGGCGGSTGETWKRARPFPVRASLSQDKARADWSFHIWGLGQSTVSVGKN
jgi:hypothetical protein